MYHLWKCPIFLRCQTSLWIQAREVKALHIWNLMFSTRGIAKSLHAIMQHAGCNIFNSKEPWKDSNDLIVKLQQPKMGQQAFWRCWQPLAQLKRFTDAVMPCWFHFYAEAFWKFHFPTTSQRCRQECNLWMLIGSPLSPRTVVSPLCSSIAFCNPAVCFSLPYNMSTQHLWCVKGPVYWNLAMILLRRRP